MTILYHCKMEFGNAYLLLVFTLICVVPSSTQNSELVDNIDKLELSVFWQKSMPKLHS